MGDILSRIDDDYREYIALCEKYGLTPQRNFLQHLREIKQTVKEDKNEQR